MVIIFAFMIFISLHHKLIFTFTYPLDYLVSRDGLSVVGK